jgi:hypothetical protein
MRAGLILSVGLTLACGCGDDGGTGGSAIDGGGGVGIDADPSLLVDADIACEAPDMLLLIDRTMSMHRRPDGTRPPNTPAGLASSKWSLAVNSIESVTATLEGSIRFGIALFPVDPGGDVCVTLEQRITGTTATNTACEEGEVLVSPDISTAAAINAAIDVETTRLCTSTPIGAGIATATAGLAAIKSPVRQQFVVLLTDGEDTCDEDLVLSNMHALADSGVNAYVIGFDSSGGGIDNGLLNDLACAGRTATGFPTPCVADGMGHYTATDRGGPALYQIAEDAAQLTQTFQDFAGEVCCGCVD